MSGRGQLAAGSAFDPQHVNLDTASARDIVCYLNASSNGYNGNMPARISALFVILVVSTAATVFPVLATKVRRLHIPLYVYLFARYFGAGVIVATAFIHLLDPAYHEIGPGTCVGMTGGWASYSWPPALAMASVMFTFLMDFAAERYVEYKYGFPHTEVDVDGLVTGRAGSVDAAAIRYSTQGDQGEEAGHAHTHPQGHSHQSHQFLHSGDQDRREPTPKPGEKDAPPPSSSSKEEALARAEERSFYQQIAAFLILEFGVIFHSVIIGLALSTAGAQFSTLYPVIVFHQSFEGLGIGARMSAIPFPHRLRWMPWWLCAGYGLTTPISIAVGLGLRTTYNAGSFTANIVSGVLDSVSAGILLYTGLVELLARDFLFNPERTNDNRQLAFMIFSVLLGAGIMALLGKWA